MKKILVIQTAFFGDVILATALVEQLHAKIKDVRISMLVREGNQALLKDHPFLDEVIVWNKRGKKFRNLVSVTQKIRKSKFDVVLNLQRFSSTGLITLFSGAPYKAGFDKNPFAFAFDYKVKHDMNSGLHETERNSLLVHQICEGPPSLPKLYPSEADFSSVQQFKTERYVTMAPASVWFTKQLPHEKWIEMIRSAGNDLQIFLIGAGADFELCESIVREAGRSKILNLAGKLKPLQTAALMRDAVMNYVNDSGPLHIASAMNAPVTAFFCSTVPAFGFGPLSAISHVLETQEHLDCRPCGLHGYMACPKGHYRCATTIIMPVPGK